MAPTLSDDGRLAVVEPLEKIPGDSNDLRPADRFWIVDLKSGRRMKEFSRRAIVAAAKEVRPLCLVSSAKALFVSADDVVYRVELASGRATAVAYDFLEAHPGCVVGDD